MCIRDRRIAGGDPDHKIFKLMEFTGSGRDVADPWYTGDFDTTWSDVTEGCAALQMCIRDRSWTAAGIKP